MGITLLIVTFVILAFNISIVQQDIPVLATIIALGVMQALQDKGIRVPEDMALITFDSYPFSLFTEPQTTVVDINMYDMGQEAGRLILKKLKNPKTQIQTFITLPELIIRGTT